MEVLDVVQTEEEVTLAAPAVKEKGFRLISARQCSVRTIAALGTVLFGLTACGGKA